MTDRPSMLLEVTAWYNDDTSQEVVFEKKVFAKNTNTGILKAFQEHDEENAEKKIDHDRIQVRAEPVNPNPSFG